MHTGTRERKKLRTRTAIESAVIRLVSASSLDAVSIDAISAEADCTPRTFFNHFASKEDALLGVPRQGAPVEIDISQLHDTAACDTPFAMGVVLVRSQLEALDEEQLRFHAQRGTVLQRYPHLLPRQYERFEASSQSTVEVLDAALERFGEPRGQARTDHARAIGLTLGVAVRLAIEGWCRGDQRPENLLKEFERSISLIGALFEAPQSKMTGLL